jgi:hypothetical protein
VRIPGFSTTTNWPRTGRTDASGTRLRAPSPVQLTTTGASASAKEDTVRVSITPPAARNRSRSHGRWTAMSISGSRARTPLPPYSPAVAARSPGTRAATQPATSSRPVSPSTPSTMRTPVASGRRASSPYTSRDRSAHVRASATGSMR